MAALFSLGIYLLFSFLIARKFDAIAVLKGHPPRSYFWWCFWLGFPGWLMVIALPDRGSAQTLAVSDELPDL